jgi:2-keto-4-pentenoate hydratase/2-oxohepta-3-ene-1,7-dioic acid hydratase in catechol pathway
MRLLSIRRYDETRVGVLVDGLVLDTVAAYKRIYGDDRAPHWLHSMRSLISLGAEGLEFLSRLVAKARNLEGTGGVFLRQEETEFLPPVPDPRKVLCVAANYVSHGKELEIKVPEKPYFFVKLINTLIGHNAPIIAPRTSSMIDYEVELAVIIGKRCKYVSRRDAMDCVFGYTVFNDISFRDKQFPPGWPKQLNPYGQNWILGKSLDTAAPCGPFIVTADELGSPYPLRLTLKVNGEVRQDGVTTDMFHRIDALIEYVSDGITLEPGDIIATGTPAGVAAASGKSYLKPGDVVEAEVERIGVLRNPVVAE